MNINHKIKNSKEKTLIEFLDVISEEKLVLLVS